MTTPQPSTEVGMDVGVDLGGRGHLVEHRLLARVPGQPVAVGRPAALAAEEEHRRVLPRAVVLEPCRLRAALEIVLVHPRLGEQAEHGSELIRTVEVRRAGDRDLPVVEIGTRTNERECLKRLRRAAEVRDEVRIAGRRDDRTVGDCDGMDGVPSLHDAGPSGLDHDRSHGAGAYLRDS